MSITTIPNEIPALLSAGIPIILVFGVREDGSCRCRSASAVNTDCWAKSPGKHPVAKKRWQEDGLLWTIEEVQQALYNEPGSNFGVALGHPMKDGRVLFAIDIDTDGAHKGNESVARLVSEGKTFTPTLTDRTGGGGQHRFLAAPAGTKLGNAKPMPGIDIRGLGGMVVVAPSVTNKGKYTWADLMRIADAQEWEIALAQGSGKEIKYAEIGTVKTRENLTDVEIAQCEIFEQEKIKEVTSWLEMLKTVPLDKQPSWGMGVWQASKDLFRLVNTPWSKFTAEQAVALIIEHAPQDSGYGIDRIKQNIASGAASVKTEAYPLPENQYPARSWDDFGNADRLMDFAKGELLYIRDIGAWAIHHDGIWHMDEETLAFNLYLEMVESLPTTEALSYSDVAKGEEEDSPREKFLNYVKKMRYVRSMKSTLTAATSKTKFSAVMDDFDADEFLFGVKNGVVDLRTGELHERTADMKITNVVDIEYDPDAKCPQFLKYLERVQPAQDARDCVWKWSGYCLTGSMKEQKIMMQEGPPASGKSVYLTCMNTIMGPYYTVANADLLHQTRGEQHPTGLAILSGKRCVQASESNEGRRLNEAIINSLTSSEPIAARFMHKDFFSYKPSAKINYTTNHKPGANTTSGIWRRMIVAPWEEVIPEAERDLGLAERLIAEESAGILTWAVQGAVSWFANGLNIPKAWTDAKARYKNDEDRFGQMFRACFVLDAEAKTTSSDIYFEYKMWCKDNGEWAAPSTAFGKLFAEYIRAEGLGDKLKNGKWNSGKSRGWGGLKVKPVFEKPESLQNPTGFGHLIE